MVADALVMVPFYAHVAVLDHLNTLNLDLRVGVALAGSTRLNCFTVSHTMPYWFVFLSRPAVLAQKPLRVAIGVGSFLPLPRVTTPKSEASNARAGRAASKDVVSGAV